MQDAAPRFERATAFSRTVGWITDGEMAELGRKRVAIAGLGGVGGRHLLTLTRLGIGRFNLAEMDAFELANFNRQAGARCSTIGLPKLEVMAGLAQDINPELDLRLFPEGLTDGNLVSFLDGADLYVDSLDFFAFEARRAVFAACDRMGIPAITAAPLGMGAALLCFRPGGMTFEDYFRLAGCDPFEQSLRLLVGLAPAHLHAGYLADRSRVDLAGGNGPSTAMACELCAGIAGSEALRILLHRSGGRWAPHGLQFDAYRQRLARTWIPWGNAHPLQRLRLALARRFLAPARTTA
ncbi:MAG: ThiF family adenylyltransferase [Planctomycetes bacterium]|nr:ThiF family adenylyltransferase [Planctomycetota bacterium]